MKRLSYVVVAIAALSLFSFGRQARTSTPLSSATITCDPSVDAAAAINKGISALGGTGGDITLSAGICMIYEPITIPILNNGLSMVRIIGSGQGTILRVSNKNNSFNGNNGVFVVNGSLTTISDMTIQGEGLPTWAIAQNLGITGDQNLPNRFERLNISEFGTITDYSPSSAANGGAIFVNFGHYKVLDSAFVMNATAIYQNGGSNNGAVISHNNIMGGNAIYIGQLAPDANDKNGHHAEGFIIQANHISTPRGAGIVIDGGLELRIDNNMIGPVGTHGILVQAAIWGVSLVHITNNWVTGAASTGLAIELAPSGSTGVADTEIQGNTLPYGAALKIASNPNGGEVQRVLISNNNFTSQSGSTPAYSLILNNAYTVIVNSNIFKSSDTGEAWGISQTGGLHIRVAQNSFVKVQNQFSDQALVKDNSPDDW